MAARNLKKGSTGSDVSALQKKLKKLGYYSGKIDGVFGDATESALKKFQKANGLKASGTTDSKTRAALAGKTKKAKLTTTIVKKGKKKKSKNKSSTHVIGEWNGHKFIVSAKTIRSFSDLQIKGSCDAQEKKKGKQGKVYRKSGNPTEVSLSIILNAFTGSDVRKHAKKFVSEARAGKKGYFYVGKKKLVPCRLMLTAASVKEIEISQGGKWTSAEVSLTMKQCGKGKWTDDSNKKKTGSRKKSVKKSSPSSSKKTSRASSKKTSGSAKTAKSSKAKKKTTTKTTKNALNGKKNTGSKASQTKQANATVRKMIKTAKKSSGSSGGRKTAMTR